MLRTITPRCPIIDPRKHNDYKKLMKLVEEGKVSPGCVADIDVCHDDWCRTLPPRPALPRAGGLPAVRARGGVLRAPGRWLLVNGARQLSGWSCPRWCLLTGLFR